MTHRTSQLDETGYVVIPDLIGSTAVNDIARFMENVSAENAARGTLFLRCQFAFARPVDGGLITGDRVKVPERFSVARARFVKDFGEYYSLVSR